MNILNLLKQEERKLQAAYKQVAAQLRGLRTAIVALNGHHATPTSGGRSNTLKGKKLSAAHRKAIKAGIAKAKAAKAKAAGKA